MVRHDVDIERGPPPSKMEKAITILSKIFKVKRYIVMFFLAWVAFAFTCAHKDEITEFIPEHKVPTGINTSPLFRSDRTKRHKELMELGPDSCVNIGDGVNVAGRVLFSPTIVESKGKVVRVRITQEDGTVVLKERHTCVLAEWTDQVFTKHREEFCSKDGFCIQHIVDIIQSHARSEL